MKKFTNIILATLLCLTFLLPIITNNAEAISKQWVEDEKGWWYRDLDGTSPGYPALSWRVIDDAWQYFKSDGYWKASMPKNKYLNGMDISVWQGNIDWSQVKNSYIDFAFIRLGISKNGYKPGYGNTVTEEGLDRKYLRNITEANKYDVPVGVYLYSYATTIEQSKADAKYVIKMLDGHKVSYPVAIDIEDACQNKLSRKELTQIAKVFCDEIASAGYTPMVYSNDNFYLSRLNFGDLPGVEKWIAAWGFAPNKYIPRDIWQSCSTGRVPGVRGDVDINFSFKDYSKLTAPRYSANGWRKDSKGWWFLNPDGTWPSNEFKDMEDGKRYYFDSDGYMTIGWVYDENTAKWYYANDNGALHIGWKEVGNYWYYMNEDYEMVTGKISIGSIDYYLMSSGKMATGWVKDVNMGKWYYALPSGELHKGWKQVGDYWYYMDENKEMVSGKMGIGSNKYYFNSSGTMTIGWAKDEDTGEWYYANSDGSLHSGWKEIGGYWYYLDENNEMVTGVYTIENRDSYFYSTGQWKGYI